MSFHAVDSPASGVREDARAAAKAAALAAAASAAAALLCLGGWRAALGAAAASALCAGTLAAWASASRRAAAAEREEAGRMLAAYAFLGRILLYKVTAAGEEFWDGLSTGGAALPGASEAGGRRPPLREVLRSPERAALWEEAVSAGELCGFSYPADRDAGGEAWVSECVAPFLGRGGRVAVYGVAMDRTAERRLRQSLASLEEDVSRACALAGFCLFSHDFGSGRTAFTGGGWLGSAPSSLGELAAPEDRDAVAAALAAAATGGAPLDIQITANNGGGCGERRHIRLMGQLSGVLRPGEPPPPLKGVALDVTASVSTERELRRSVAEMERFNKSMTGREMRVLQLKAEVNELLAALGRPPRYVTTSVSADPAGEPSPPRLLRPWRASGVEDSP